MPEDFRVLIHADRDEKQLPAWDDWQAEQCLVLPFADHQRMETLQDVSYAESLPDGTRIVLGGLEADACVNLHAMTLLTTDEVTRRDISVVFDATALRGNIEFAIDYIQRQTGKTVEVIHGEEDEIESTL